MDFKETVVDVSKKATAAATKTYKVVADKSGKLFEETKLKISNSDMEVEITKLFENIGIKVLEIYNSGKKVDKEVEKDIKQIEKLKKEIEKNDEQILHLKNQRVCDNCDEIIDIDIKFCPYCGEKQKKVKIKEDKQKKEEVTEKTCPDCGTVHLPDVNFCTKCGYKF